jgi:hypothetical protein
LDLYILQGVLLVLEANANFFYILKLKWEGDRWESLAKTAKLNAEKLTTASNLFQSYKKVDVGLVQYCTFTASFYKAFALWS